MLYYKLWNVNLLLKKLLNEKSLGSYISLEIVKVTFWKYAPTRGLIYLVWNYWTALECYYNINLSTFNCCKKYELKQKKLGSNLLISCWKTLSTLELANFLRVLAYCDRKSVGNKKSKSRRYFLKSKISSITCNPKRVLPSTISIVRHNTKSLHSNFSSTVLRYCFPDS